MTPADRLALALCRDRWPSLNCQQSCSYCRRNATAVAHELAALLRERHGHSTTADWLEAIGSHKQEPQTMYESLKPTPAAIEAMFRGWWGLSFATPPGVHAINTHVGFGVWLLESMGSNERVSPVSLYEILKQLDCRARIGTDCTCLDFYDKDSNLLGTIEVR